MPSAEALARQQAVYQRWVVRCVVERNMGLPAARAHARMMAQSWAEAEAAGARYYAARPAHDSFHRDKRQRTGAEEESP